MFPWIHDGMICFRKMLLPHTVGALKISELFGDCSLPLSRATRQNDDMKAMPSAFRYSATHANTLLMCSLITGRSARLCDSVSYTVEGYLSDNGYLHASRACGACAVLQFWGRGARGYHLCKPEGAPDMQTGRTQSFLPATLNTSWSYVNIGVDRVVSRKGTTAAGAQNVK